jgi:hypothetical protein
VLHLPQLDQHDHEGPGLVADPGDPGAGIFAASDVNHLHIRVLGVESETLVEIVYGQGDVGEVVVEHGLPG